MGQAQAEANRCLLCHDAPCSKACPAGTEPGIFLRKLRLRNLTGAIRVIKERNVLGGSCGALCPAERLCESACCAAGLDRPIRIGDVQRALVEHGWRTGFQPLEKAGANGLRVAVVGAGPAGLSCAATLAREGFQVTVFEARSRAGGVLAFGVPSYRLPPAFLSREIEDLGHLGVELKLSTPVDGRGAAEALLKQGFSAVFLGTGCWEPIRLFENGFVPENVLTATDFLSALRDGRGTLLRPVIEGQTVAVLGGGSVAIDCAGSALLMGAREVHLVYRRAFEQMPAELSERTHAQRHGVHFLLLHQPVGYLKDALGKLAGLRVVRTRLGEPDASGRRRPENIPGSEWVLDTKLVIEALGSRPAQGFAASSPSVQRTADGLIVADLATRQTSTAGVFAGGDAVRGPALIANAIFDGKAAARAIREGLLGRRASPAGGKS
jgi:NADPH-dependent glutamate synthase beta subunit-like oxidoreductase